MGARGNVMKSNSLIDEITEMINSHGKGTIFSIHDFYHLGTKNSVKSSLLRLEKKGEIERLVDGMYVIPKYSEILNEFSYPSVDDLAIKIAEKFSWTICPSGDHALNILGLSTQVPSKYIYISNGPYRIYEYQNIEIIFKHSSSRYIIDYSQNISLIIQAIKTLGKENITEEIIRKLEMICHKYSIEDLLLRTNKLPNWIYEILIQIDKHKMDE
jgi:hypothetical protein